MTHTVHADLTRLGAAVPLNDYERLFNALMKLGAQRTGLRAHVVGGAHVIAGRRKVGHDLADYVLAVLQREGIPLDTTDVGGFTARRCRFAPATGTLTVVPVRSLPDEADRRPTRPIIRGVELF
ncbi:hypothetical protein [Jannaschia sp. LMIT008]|uniref:hypothetical protein n=1 Tax=Jannaschia maritima TaxID=3032585 RepID=UPI002810FD24|nr:hypothetical protein [Jannaschia sp. LMIT008]